MKKWHKSNGMDLGRMLLRWRHRDVRRFYMKMLSWLLAAFIMGILTSIVCVTFGLYDQALSLSRLVFFLTLAGGLINSFFIWTVVGPEHRIYENAFVAVRPLIGYAPWAEKWGSVEKPLGARLEHLAWEEIKEARSQDGQLVLILKKELQELPIGVAPVLMLDQISTVKYADKKAGNQDDQLNRETIKLILQKIREIKKTANPKG